MPDTYVSPSRSSLGEDGRWTHTFSQTTLSNFQQCPEQARQILHKEVTSETTDSNALGTGAHSGAEYLLFEKRAGREPDLRTAIEVAINTIDDIGEWKYTKMSRKSVYATVPDLVTRFAVNILPLVEPLDIERKFDVLLYEGKHRTIRLAGTMDCVDHSFVPHDWKFPGHTYEQWEKQRFAIQPTVYCYAVDALHNPDHVTGEMGEYVFTYGITTIDGETQVFDVARGPGHVAWLKQVCSQVAWMIENMGQGPWPMLDAGWHCSEKWCPVFAAGKCKGEHMADDWKVYPK